MGGSSKFSLPLTGRRSRPQMDAIVDTSPLAAPHSTLSKAERLLGTSGLAGQSPQLRPQQPPSLISRSSYRSLAMSEASVGKASENERGSASTTRLISRQRHPTYAVRSTASSDVLGARQEDAYAESATSGTTWQVPRRESSSTLKSYYDPRKAPLAISQQTSNSAVRDMALRKGKPPAVRPIPPAYADVPAPTASVDSGVEAPEPTPAPNRKHKPPRLDFSRLFPKPTLSPYPLLSPNNYVDSPSALSTTTEYFPVKYATSHRSKPSTAITPSSRSGNRLSKMWSREAKASELKTTEQRVANSRDEVGVFKSNVRRPPRGIQNWFDGLLEEEDENDLEEDITALPPVLGSESRRGTELDSELDEPLLTSHSAAELAGKPVSNLYHQSLKTHTNTRSRSNKLASSNLRESSIICWSDEESGTEDVVFQVPRARDSIAMADIGETILIGKAHAFDINRRSRHAVDGPSERQGSNSSSARSNAMASSKQSLVGDGTYLAVPPSQVRRNRHARQTSSIREDDEEEKYEPSPRSLSQPTRGIQGDGHKLMAVTADEEVLLEMMRRKRAAMAKHSFAEGYRTALKQEPKGPTTPPRVLNIPIRSPSAQTLVVRKPHSPASIIDSFPISNSQRSSLILAASLPSPPPSSALPDPPVEPPSKRLSRGSQHTATSPVYSSVVNVNRFSQTTSTSALSIDDRLGRTSSRNPSPPTTVSSVDATSAKPKHSPTPSSDSQTSPVPSPVTPDGQRGTEEVNVAIKYPSSYRDSGTSSIAIDAAEQNLLEEMEPDATECKPGQRSHRRASSVIRLSGFGEVDGFDDLARPLTAPTQPPEKGRRGSGLHIQTSTADRQRYTDRTREHQVGVGPRKRSSVSDDILAAWAELGGSDHFDFTTGVSR